MKHIINTTASHTLAHTVGSVMLLSRAASAPLAPQGGAGRRKPPNKVSLSVFLSSGEAAGTTEAVWTVLYRVSLFAVKRDGDF